MLILAILLSAVTLVLAAVHLLWAVGYWFPIRAEADLVAAVIGTKGVTRMPGPIPCALVVVALLVACATPWIGAGALQSTLLGGIAAVFAIRGIASFIKPWRRAMSQEPFRTLDIRYYGPLCIALGLGYAALLFVPIA